jgi:hypothetical protein
MPPKQDGADDDETDPVLRLRDGRNDSDRDRGFAPSGDEKQDRAQQEQGSDRVHLSPQRRVVPSDRHEKVERCSEQAGPDAPPA